jgi:hypothetical protein
MTFTTPHHTRVEGWTIGWGQIAELIFVQDFASGRHLWKVFIVCTHDGKQQWLAIAKHITAANLVATLRSYDRQLVIASAADLGNYVTPSQEATNGSAR